MDATTPSPASIWDLVSGTCDPDATWHCPWRFNCSLISAAVLGTMFTAANTSGMGIGQTLQELVMLRWPLLGQDPGPRFWNFITTQMVNRGAFTFAWPRGPLLSPNNLKCIWGVYSVGMFFPIPRILDHSEEGVLDAELSQALDIRYENKDRGKFPPIELGSHAVKINAPRPGSSTCFQHIYFRMVPSPIVSPESYYKIDSLKQEYTGSLCVTKEAIQNAATAFKHHWPDAAAGQRWHFIIQCLFLLTIAGVILLSKVQQVDTSMVRNALATIAAVYVLSLIVFHLSQFGGSFTSEEGDALKTALIVSPALARAARSSFSRRMQGVTEPCSQPHAFSVELARAAHNPFPSSDEVHGEEPDHGTQYEMQEPSAQGQPSMSGQSGSRDPISSEKPSYYFAYFLSDSQYLAKPGTADSHPTLHFILLPTIRAGVLPIIFGLLRCLMDTIAPAGMYTQNEALLGSSSAVFVLFWALHALDLWYSSDIPIYAVIAALLAFNPFARMLLFRWTPTEGGAQWFRTFVVHAPCLVFTFLSQRLLHYLLS